MRCLLTDRKGFTKELETRIMYRVLCVPDTLSRFYFLPKEGGWIPEGIDDIKVVQFRLVKRDEDTGVLLYEEEL